MKCPHCGAQLQSSELFCPVCGGYVLALQTDDAEAPVVPVQVPQDDTDASPTAEAPVSPPPSGKHKSRKARRKAAAASADAQSDPPGSAGDTPPEAAEASSAANPPQVPEETATEPGTEPNAAPADTAPVAAAPDSPNADAPDGAAPRSENALLALWARLRKRFFPPKGSAEGAPAETGEGTVEGAVEGAGISTVFSRLHFSRLQLVVLLLCGALLLSCIYIFASNFSASSRRIQLIMARKDQITDQNTIADLNAQVDTLTETLNGTRAENDELSAQVSDLQGQITDLENAANQNAYDTEGIHQSLSDAQAANASLTTQLEESQTALQSANESLASLQSDYDSLDASHTTLQDDYDSLQNDYDNLQSEMDAQDEENADYKEEADFVNTYVVFVENDGTNYYHTYDCALFTKKSFWAYSRTLAQRAGYTACPVCGGGA